MSRTKEYLEFYECTCGESSVGFNPVIGHMDSYYATLKNCTSKGIEYHREYTCNSCGEMFNKADPSMIGFEKE